MFFVGILEKQYCVHLQRKNSFSSCYTSFSNLLLIVSDMDIGRGSSVASSRLISCLVILFHCFSNVLSSFCVHDNFFSFFFFVSFSVSFSNSCFPFFFVTFLSSLSFQKFTVVQFLFDFHLFFSFSLGFFFNFSILVFFL